MGEKEETKVMWITCPECGAKLGIIISVGGVRPSEAKAITIDEIKERLSSIEVDPSILEFTQEGDLIVVTPRKFLGELWGKINDVMKALGGVWVREGKESRWEIRI